MEKKLGRWGWTLLLYYSMIEVTKDLRGSDASNFQIGIEM